MTFHDPKLQDAMKGLEDKVQNIKHKLDTEINPDIDNFEEVMQSIRLRRTVWLAIGTDFAIGWAETTHGKYRLAFSTERMHANPKILRDAAMTLRAAAHPHLGTLAYTIRHQLKI